mgnify:CR=1 FL=1
MQEISNKVEFEYKDLDEAFPACDPGVLPFGSRVMVQVRTHRRPFGGNDAVDHGVTDRAIGRHLVRTQHAVEFCAQTFDGIAAGVIEPVGAKFHRNAAQRVKGVRQQQPLALGVQGRSLHTASVPG